MEKSEIECCGTTHLHDSLVHQIEDGMPKEETIRELSDLLAGRRAYTEHFESGNRAYNRVEAV